MVNGGDSVNYPTEPQRAIMFFYFAALLDILFTAVGIWAGVGQEGSEAFAWMPLLLMVPYFISVKFIVAAFGLAIAPLFESYKLAQFIFGVIFYYMGISHLIIGAGSWYYLFRCVGYLP